MRTDPLHQLQQLCSVALQVTSVNRLVMRDAIAQEVQALYAVLHIGTDPMRIWGIRVPRKRGCSRWHPD